ncbi:serine/threonine-protein kinase 31-like isoform X1 [Oculina patagonica]
MFWAQTAELETAQVIEKMDKDLQIYCRNKPLLQSTPHIDKVYGGVYPEDKKWYRCRVKELMEDNQVQVHFVDYGNTEVISLRTIVFLSHEILSLVPFAQLFCLDGVAATNSEVYDKGVDMLHNLTDGKLLTIKLKETKKSLDFPCPVELRDDSEGGIGNIAFELIKQGLVTATEQDGPPPLSPSDDFIHRSTLSEAMTKEMEELRNENEYLKNVIKMHKENEKAVDELRKYFSAQEVKYKENMEQAVNRKFLELASKVSCLKTMRDTTPGNGKASVVIREAIELRESNRIDLEALKSLHQVQESERNLMSAQECLCLCKDKDELLAGDIVSKRDEARQELFDTIDLFCKEVNLIPLQEREKSLQHALGQLQEQEDALDNCSTDPVLEGAVEAYQEWRERSLQDVTDIRQKVNQCTDDFTTALASFQLAMKLSQDSSETVSRHTTFGDFDAMINALLSAVQEEMDKSKVSEDKEAKKIVDSALKALAMELNRELADIQELRDNLMTKYRSLQADMSPWLEAKPDVKKMGEVRRAIKSLRSRLRHRLADKKDLEEGDELLCAEDFQKVESDICDIYLQLHQSFEEESKYLADLAKMAAEQFPELPIAHPELGISEFLASNGLVKPGRELEHYPHHDSEPTVCHDKCSAIKSEFAGRPCILKELKVDRQLGDIDTLKGKAVNFSSVNNPFLMPLDAFFVKGNRAFVQMPLLMSGEEWLASRECSSEDITLVLRDILDALNALHLKNICHGCVRLQSVFVEQRSGEYRGILDFFPFTNSQCSQAQEMKFFGELIVKMNFPDKDSATTFSELTKDADLLAVLGDLLDTDDVDRLTAQQTLQQAYFCKCV